MATDDFHPGDRVQVLGGLRRDYGMPLGVVRSVGPTNCQVQLYYDAKTYALEPKHLRNQGPGDPLVIVACGGRKLDHAAEAVKMYIGSYHQAAMRAARALVPRTHVRILSAKYGLLHLFNVIEPYDLRLGQPGAITAKQLHDQAEGSHDLVQARVIVLAGKEYVSLCAAVWPYLDAPLADCAGIGEQLHLLKRITEEAR